jgi:hypothetical protein
VIAVCLLTCERRAYTATTLRSFAALNDTSRFELLHGDDASSDAEVPALATAFGFRTLVRPKSRQGWLPMRLKLFKKAIAKGADWILFLENDHEWVRPFPWALFEVVSTNDAIGCLRLQGEFKDRRGAEPHMVYHKSDRRKPVEWRPMTDAPEPAQITRIHWSAQPSVTRVDDLMALHQHGMESPRLTARVVNNVTFHIGTVRTRTLEPLGACA